MKITITKGDNPISRLFAETPSIASEAEYRKLMIVEELLTLMAENGISRGELAKRMEVQPSRVTSILSGTNNFTIETLVRAGRAVGADIELHFVPMKKDKTQGQTAKPRAEEDQVSKVAEDPTPYHAQKPPAKKAVKYPRGSRK
jgi:plasmid maintenance system antidote protein VapI